MCLKLINFVFYAQEMMCTNSSACLLTATSCECFMSSSNRLAARRLCADEKNKQTGTCQHTLPTYFAGRGTIVSTNTWGYRTVIWQQAARQKSQRQPSGAADARFARMSEMQVFSQKRFPI